MIRTGVSVVGAGSGAGDSTAFTSSAGTATVASAADICEVVVLKKKVRGGRG